jgi:hypothetical protein
MWQTAISFLPSTKSRRASRPLVTATYALSLTIGSF